MMKSSAKDKDANGIRHRLWSDPRASLRQEVFESIASLLWYSDMLLSVAEEREYDILLENLRDIRASCGRVQERAYRLLSSTQPPPDEDKARHNLINSFGPIILCCDMLLKDAREQVYIDAFVPDLRRMKALASCLERQINDLFSLDRLDGSDSMSREEVAGLPPCSPSKAVPAVETGRVLVVDDDEDIRGVLCRQLECEGHQTAAAANGRIALEMLRQRPFDLVLLDMLMPELGGFETLLRVKTDEHLRQVPVIMVTALDKLDSAARCIEHGAEDYLIKPFNTVLLRARIGACLEKKRLRDREDELLHAIYPSQVIPELIKHGTVRPRLVENVAVLFADLVGFTRYCEHQTPEQVVARLQALIETWEEIAIRHHVLKIKTIGDAFMAACGLLEKAPDDPVLCTVRFGLEMIEATHKVAPDWSVRVGIHVGPVVAGVVGRRQFLFDLWGHTVNTAARMESHGRPNRVNLSPKAWERVAAVSVGQPNPGKVKSLGSTKMMILRSLTAQGAEPALLAAAAEER